MIGRRHKRAISSRTFRAGVREGGSGAAFRRLSESDHVAKPVSTEELAKTLSQWLAAEISEVE